MDNGRWQGDTETLATSLSCRVVSVLHRLLHRDGVRHNYIFIVLLLSNPKHHARFFVLKLSRVYLLHVSHWLSISFQFSVRYNNFVYFLFGPIMLFIRHCFLPLSNIFGVTLYYRFYFNCAHCGFVYSFILDYFFV